MSSDKAKLDDANAPLRARLEVRIAALPRETLIALLAEAACSHNRSRANVDAALHEMERQRPPPIITADLLELCLKCAGTLTTFRAMRVSRDWRTVAERPSLHTTLILEDACSAMTLQHPSGDAWYGYMAPGPQQLPEGQAIARGMYFDNRALERCLRLAAGQLRKLVLTNFVNVSDHGLKTLRDHRDLEYVDISDCKHVSASVLAHIPPWTSYVCLWNCNHTLHSCSLAPFESTVGRCHQCKTVLSYDASAPATADPKQMWLRRCPQPGCNLTFCVGGASDCNDGLRRCDRCYEFYKIPSSNHGDLHHDTTCWICDECETWLCSQCGPILECEGCSQTFCDTCRRKASLTSVTPCAECHQIGVVASAPHAQP